MIVWFHVCHERERDRQTDRQSQRGREGELSRININK